MKPQFFLFLTFLSFVPLQIRPSIAATIDTSNGLSAININSDQQQPNTGETVADWQTWRDTALYYAKTGELDKAKKALQESEALLTIAEGEDKFNHLHAHILDVDAYISMLQGNNTEALETWKKTAAIYRQAGDNNALSLAVLNQIQALQNLGYYHQAEKQIKLNYEWLKQQSDNATKVKAIQTFGDIESRLNRYEKAIIKLEEAQSIAKNNNYVELLPELALNLGNAYQSLGNIEQSKGEAYKATNNGKVGEVAKKKFVLAEEKYTAAIEQYQHIPTNTIFGVQAQINILGLLQNKADEIDITTNTTREQIEQIQESLKVLPPTRPVLYARINFVRRLFSEPTSNSDLIQQQLTTTYKQAIQLGDIRSKSHVLGLLGKLYLTGNRLIEAKKLTNEAIAILPVGSEDLRYQWQWQLGKIYRQQDNNIEAIIAYKGAFDNLQEIRSELIAVTSDTRFSFNEEIEPVYREFIDLLLTPDAGQAKPSQENLLQARTVLEALQLAELDNFFRDACIPFQEEEIDKIIDQNELGAAVIYPIILSDRLAVITSFPNGTLDYKSTSVKSERLELVIQEMRASLSRAYPTEKRIEISLLFYQSLIKPFENEFQDQEVTSLVFVLDGSLRNIPMAALHDGEKYLIEKYAIALTPGLKLLQSPELSSQQLQQVILGGISKSTPNSPPLPDVTKEVEQISARTEEQLLLNEALTEKAFGELVKNLNYPIVHLATHGEFSSSPEGTFLRMWDQELSILELRTLLEQRNRPDRIPIEMMVLSACQTAAGDKRAALGLAGLSVRSGVRTTVATLWSVNDQSTAKFMGIFYDALQDPTLNKSDALRYAQLELLKDSNFRHPYYWAPFVMIGNWF
ncbi:tetratricopeptide domain protein [[Leptolyngbya] sp. PCC 7376]|uniref:CHAT domain-containing protein n=1 Tax=[Leptolyngbya] sp. PCC 7376 TaxID=111781 RepID=UPI00029ED27C|nr:CHAT domain-containing protein [[Leptolyngbya] sp. PCC 7376]AFY39956.1 tetratricopeptide domain protein [[Leptolyngbya] sp. PCC 7376]